MKLSSAYLADRLRERYEIVSQDHISGEDEYFRSRRAPGKSLCNDGSLSETASEK